MARRDEFYEYTNYFEYDEELGVFNLIKSDFSDDLKKLAPEYSVLVYGELLDEISYKQYGNELLWWVIGLYNDIIDPFERTRATLDIPRLSDVEALMLKYVEERRLQ